MFCPNSYTIRTEDAVMVKVGSLFTQVLSLMNCHEFAHAVRQWNAKPAAKGFHCWDQFVAMDRGYIDYELSDRWQIELFFKGLNLGTSYSAW